MLPYTAVLGVSADRYDFDELLDMIEDGRPLQLVFQHPWQKDDRVYYNSWTEDEQDDRPEELEDVYKTMKQLEAGGGRRPGMSQWQIAMFSSQISGSGAKYD